MFHELKIKEAYLDRLISGNKKSEVRCNDRDYQKGDVLVFIKNEDGIHKKHLFEITHVHSGLGMEKNYVVLSLYKKDAYIMDCEDGIAATETDE